MIWLFLFWKHRRKWVRMKSERVGKNLVFSYAEYPEKKVVAQVVSEIIQKEFLKTDFPIRAGDDIEDTLDIAAEDFDELVEKSLNRCDISLDADLEKKDKLPVRTVDDLVSLISSLREQQKAQSNDA